ncbi:TMEM175 family protein [Actinoplanes sp. Pm04-4]|uniref:TMEM175 family protein n=1 Tax=Paractinoplanes pyxinae TaxID=2997416 RepID=A0ABT4B0Y9_9ACTN|nr:TMEM175 family protein [Actinoplanes pyxinae]MCY1140135.1 TMEM175 family protein [Actinoplanes pyxinae]
MTTTTHASEVEKASAERLKFFSDAVIAIAMTLLALELPVPSGETVGEVWRSFGGNWEEYLAFLITFWVIGQQWMNHHSFLRYVDRVPHAFVRLNVLWLLTVVVTPFAMRILVSEAPFEFGFTLYGIVQVLSALIRFLMIRQIRGHDLAGPEAPAGFYRDIQVRLLGLALIFAVAVPFAYLIGHWAYAIWVAGPAVIGGLRRRVGRQRR